MKIILTVFPKYYWRDHAAPDRIYDNRRTVLPCPGG
jgi:hypothetical protein